MVTGKPNTTSKIIVPKQGKNSLSDEARKKLVEDLQKISPEEIEAMGENFDKIKKEKKENEKKEELIKRYSLKGVKLVVIHEYGDMSGKTVFKCKDSYGRYQVFRGNEPCGGWWMGEIGEVKNIGGKPAFVRKNGKNWSVMRGKDEYCNTGLEIINLTKTGYLIEIGGKPVFKVKDEDGNYSVCRGRNHWCGDCYKEIGEIKNIGGKPTFWAIDEKGKRYEIHGYDYKIL